MGETIHHTNCPVCGSSKLTEVLTVKDHTVSGECFKIWECGSCALRFTQDAPDAAHSGPYYQSENYISHSNSKRGMINRLYHRVRKRTLRQKRKLVEEFTGMKNGVLLDVGSGTGAFANEMAKKGWQVMGLEPDEGARALAKQIYDLELKEPGWLFEFREHVFDAITLWHVLEHVHDLQGYLTQLRRVLKANGKLFVAVPNYTSKDASIYGESWAAYDVPRHLYHFSPGSMQTLAGKHGLKILRHQPMWYDSFYISLLSSKYKKGNTNYLSAFINGIRSNLATMKDSKKCSSVIYVMGKS